LGINLDVLNVDLSTFTCFLPELETSTGFEYFTKLWGWLKFVGPWLADICNFFDLNIYLSSPTTSPKTKNYLWRTFIPLGSGQTLKGQLCILHLFLAKIRRKINAFAE
jgi:hypothetical protein